MAKGNVLFITVDQLAAFVLDGPLARAVSTPNFDRLAMTGTAFQRHFTVTIPCGPARASLLTGLYAMNHRSIRNGTPLARHHATVATEARRIGYEPLLFGYTDTTADPTEMDPEDPDLSIYEGVAPGFRELVEMRFESGFEWPGYLRQLGYEFSLGHDADAPDIYRPTPQKGNDPRPSDPAIYAAEHSDTAYLTDQTLAALDIRRHRPWFAHVAYIRPHPPLVAPSPFNCLVDPVLTATPDPARPEHPFVDAWFSEPSKHGMFWGFDGDCAGIPDDLARELRAVYLGLLAEVDQHVGRLLDWLDATGQSENTLVMLTADHGDMLGEKQMWGKDTVFEQAYHVPMILRDPRHKSPGGKVRALTESVDVAPTILDWIGAPVPPAMDGRSLLPLIAGAPPDDWRDAVFMEADFGHPVRPSRFQRHLSLSAEQTGAAILREDRWKYVHFGGGVPPMLFDLTEDPGETRDLGRDPAFAGETTRLATRMIDRMMERRDRRMTHLSIGS